VDEYFTDDDDLLFDDEPIEAYCVRCRQMIEMENPQAVWTRKGMPATRGECPYCGGTVFRMGKSPAHDDSRRPAAIEVTGSGKRKQPRLARDTVYVLYARSDEEVARQIADDLVKTGIAAWLHEHGEGEQVAWAGGVHPALTECERMVYVLSPSALNAAEIIEAWQFFRSKRKPIVIAQIDTAQPPDDIRRSPRFDFKANYRAAFREMVQVLS
jgi:hypothetical protein